MLTLEELEKSSHYQICSALAIHAMKWTRVTSRSQPAQWITRDEQGFAVIHETSETWDPMNKWNQTMEIVEKMIEFECGLEIVKNKYQCLAWFTKNGNDYTVTNNSLQRAICFAALLAVSNYSPIRL